VPCFPRPYPFIERILADPAESFAHEGINPQRINDNSRTGSFQFWWMTGTDWVGAMLYRGLPSSSPRETEAKYSSISCFLRESR
jgi:hypothetical protein